MSNSDSEDLEFESADEDQKDLSDLDIDEILNESDEQPKNKPEKSQQQPKGSTQQQTSEEKPTPMVEESSKSAVETVSKALENLETNEKNSKPDSPQSNNDLIKPDEEVKEEFEEKKEVEEKKKEETKEQPKKEEGSAWDESNLSDLDDNEEEKSEVKVEETKQPKPEEKKQTKSEEKKAATTETGWNSGWDDLEFTDIDNKKEDDAKTTPVKTDQVEPKKAAIEEKKVVQQNIPQPQKQPQQQEQSSGWSWGKLGTNLLSSAATITMQMMETVEASLGAPDPHELAARIAKSDEGQDEKTTAKDEHSKDENKPQTQANKDDWKFDNNDSDWFSINKIASTGTNLITGSLDVLESVGKKTFEMINDKDPNFKQTRELLKKVPINAAKPNLSQLLREAQSQNESSSASQMTSSSSQSSINNSKSSPKAVERSSKQEKLSFSLFFDEYKGTAHLEALEMLSSQAKVKLELLDMEKPISRYSKAIKTELERIKRLFDEKRLNNDEDDEEEDEEDEEIRRELEGLTDETKKALDLSRVEALARQFSSRSSLIANIDKMIAAFRTASLASREDALSPSELFNESIKCFALITSNMIELFHKAAEAVFVEIENSKTKIKRERIFEDVDCLYRITKLAIKAVTVLSNDYSKSCKINAKQLNESNPNHIITDIYLEASNSCVFIGDAYLLFLPMFKYLLLRTEND